MSRTILVTCIVLLVSLALPGALAVIDPGTYVAEQASAVGDAPEPPPGPGDIVDNAHHEARAVQEEAQRIVEETTHPGAGEGDGGDGRGDGGSGAPGLADGLLDAMIGTPGLIALAALGVTGLAGAGLLLATRYVDPKEALENPQRAMLYGYIRGNPGVNLKTLSDDFEMKTSTVLWHIRKLEGAELVRSTKANGFRVFYPVAGGIEAKNLGSAVAALANQNASRILDYIAVHPGVQQRGLVNALDINAGTVRWHLRKLKDTGLMAELSQGRSSTYYPTELGIKALRQTMGVPSDLKPVPEIVATANATAQ